MKISLVLLTAAFALGIGLAGFAWNSDYLCVLSAFLVGFITVQLYKRKEPIICLLLLFFFLGIIRSMQDEALPLTDSSQFIGQRVIVTGKIAEVPKITLLDTEKKIRYIVEVNQLRLAGRMVNSSGKMIVTVRQTAATQTGSSGDHVEAAGELEGLHGYNNPGSIDIVAALKRQGITARMNSSSDHISIIPAKELTGKRLLDQWRSRLSELFLQIMPQSDAAILTGVLFGGGYDTINTQVLHDFSATGIIHILSVSGSHIALVAAVMLWLGESCRLNAKATVMLAGAVILFYAALAGLSPPVIRSAIMGIAGLWAVLAGRDKSGAGAMALAALLMLVWQPALLYDISFQLSFGATAGLVFFYSKTTEKLRFLPKWLASAFAVTFAAQAGIIPFLAWYFHSFSISSFIANIIVIPIIELVIILGLLACFSSLLLPLAAKLLLVFCSMGIGLAVMLNKAIAAIEGLQFYVPPFGMLESFVFYVLLAWSYGYLPAWMQSPVSIIKRWPYRATGIILAVCLLAGGLIGPSKPVAVHFIDVGQGDATLFITPHGRSVLVDTGGTIGENSNFDVGERVVAPYLKHQGITRLDYLILTHGHKDHAGGAAAIAAVIPVRNCIVAPEAFSDSLRALLKEKGSGVIIPAARGQKLNLDGLEIEVVHAGAQAGAGRNSNEASSVIRVSYGLHSFLITGDLEAGQEEELIANGLYPCTVLKVAHHGSRTSTTDGFLEKAAPRYAVISVGYHNRFGHPHKEVLDKLDRTVLHVYRTDQDGAVLMRTNGTKLSIEPYLKRKQ